MWEHSIRFQKRRENGKLKAKSYGTSGLTVEPSRGKEKRFLYQGHNPKDKRQLKTPLGDGCCLICGDISPFYMEQDHVLGRPHLFRISLCSNCHSLKSKKYFWLLEQRNNAW